MKRGFLFELEADSEEVPYARITSRILLWRTSGVLLVLLGLSGCAELADIMLADVGRCHGCDWIIQEWDDPGWSTHNSDPYDTEEICELALANQSKKSPDRDHRCIYEGDLRHEEKSLVKPSAFCYGCDWVVEIEEYKRWERTEATTYHTEGVCQQELWHLLKRNPNRNYRCINLDM